MQILQCQCDCIKKLKHWLGFVFCVYDFVTVFIMKWILPIFLDASKFLLFQTDSSLQLHNAGPVRQIKVNVPQAPPGDEMLTSSPDLIPGNLVKRLVINIFKLFSNLLYSIVMSLLLFVLPMFSRVRHVAEFKYIACHHSFLWL